MEFYQDNIGSFDLDSPSDDIVLPYQEEDWELAAEPQHSLPYLEPDDTASSSELLEPYTQEQLTSFYHNPLLERGDIYTDQFLESSSEHHVEFKHLLIALQQAILRVAQLEHECEECSSHIQGLCQRVFDNGSSQVKAEAICKDQRKVTEVYKFVTCKFNKSVASDLKVAIMDNQRVGVDDKCLAVYSCILARLQCDQFIFEISSTLKKRTEDLANNNDSVKSRVLVQLCDESLDSVRQCINTLFFWMRKKDPTEEDDFLTLLQKWTCQLISLLYNMTQGGGCQNLLNEEMFILNHIIRSPPGTQLWADKLVQITASGVDLDFWNSKVSLDHVIYMLFLILRAPKGREEFLADMKLNSLSLPPRRNSPDASEAWTMIDEDSSDDLKGVGSKWNVLPHESDLVALYRQVPFETILAHVLSLSKNKDGIYCYTSDQINSDRFLQVIACCDLMCEVLGEGLATLGAPKYKQLVRRIAQTLRNVVLLMAEHWSNFKKNVETKPQRHSYERLQTEYDEFVKRCAERLLCVARLGVYQFLADLPFQSVSQRAAETLYVLMNVPAGSRAEVDQLSRTSYTRQEWLDFIEDPDTKLAFEDQLSGMPENEIVYLLTTFCNLAHARPSCEGHLVNIIAMDVYKVSFVYSSTRDICSKMGRELLCTVASVHPYIISTILHYLKESPREMNNTALYAVAELPFEQWMPTKPDMALLKTWILENPISSITVKIVQTCIKGLNWGTGSNGCLFLPHTLHCEMAMLLAEVCYKYEMEKQQSGLLIKSLDQVSKVASVMRSSLTIDESFLGWMWEVLLRLHLHRSQLNTSENLEVKDKPAPLVDANQGTLLPQSNKQNIPQSCYITLMVTSAGHSINVFLQQGLPILKVLIESGHKVAAVQCLACITPMFIKSCIDLSINNSFVSVLQACIAPQDSGVISGIASKLVDQNSTLPSSLSLLCGSISDHIVNDEPTVIIVYWIKLVLAMPGWWDENNAKTLLDFLFKSAFYSGQRCCDECRAVLYERHVELMMQTGKNTSNSPKHQNRFLSSVRDFVTGVCPDGAPSFLAKIAPDHLFLSYFILDAETRYEDDSKLWTTLLSFMRSMSPENALKKSSSQLKLTHTPIPNQLSIYKWTQLFLVAPLEHPLVPLVCQRFFLRFVHIIPEVGGSLGSRFFKPSHANALFKKSQTKLTKITDHWGSQASDDDFKMRLSKLFMTFGVWINEEKIHDDNLYLPSLPSHYEPHLLATVRTNNQTLWSKYVDFVKICEELQEVQQKWINFHKREIKPFPAHSSSMSVHATSFQRITQLLQQFETPLRIDPGTAESISSPVAVSHLKDISDHETVSDEIDQDLKTISQFAQSYADVKAKLDVLNRNYLELLPDLYSMEEQRVILNIECQSTFSTAQCTGPAQVQIRFTEKTLNEVVSENLKTNRISYREQVGMLTNPQTNEDLCYSALHVLNIVQALIKSTTNPIHTTETVRSVYDAGAKFFYTVADMNSGERWKCPPTQHLLTMSLDLLGQIFICGRPDQAVPLLEQMLNKPDIAALLSAHFSPAKACQDVHNNGSSHIRFNTAIFVDMYEKVVNAAVAEDTKTMPDVLFVLITKFDLEAWSHDYSPPKSDLLRLLRAIVLGLVQHSTFAPTSDAKQQLLGHSQLSQLQLSNSAVQEIFTTHLCILMQHCTSFLMYDAITLLLDASQTGLLNPIVWEALIAATFENCDENEEVADLRPTLSSECVDICVKHIAVFFDEKKKRLRSDLYKIWKPYVRSLSRLLYSLCIEDINLRTALSKVAGNDHIIRHDALVNVVLPIFSPWLRPLTDELPNVSWPWEKEEQETAMCMLGAFSSVLTVICNDRAIDISSCIATLWKFYLENVMISHELFAPSYICSSYQTALSAVPWQKFIPNLTDLDMMIQLCNSKLTCSLHFLCNIIPDIDWRLILNMCRGTEEQKWSEHTPEVLCRFLHIIFVLGSRQDNITSYPKLRDIFSSIYDFPWFLIAYEQLDYLANLVSDRYSAHCLQESVSIDAKKKITDPRYVVLRLLGVVAGICLDEKIPLTDASNNIDGEDEESAWLKRQSYVRCCGRLIRMNARSTDKTEMKAVEAITTQYMEKILKSLMLLVARENITEEGRLAAVFGEIWRYVNAFPDRLQVIIMNKVMSVIQEQANAAASKQTENERKKFDLLVRSVMSSAHQTLTDAMQLAVSLECCLDGCLSLFGAMDQDIVMQNEHFVTYKIESESETPTPNKRIELWTDLSNILKKKSKVPQQELIEACITQGSFLTLRAIAQNMCSDRDDMDSKNLTYLCCVSVAEWMSTTVPKTEFEIKLVLLIGYFLHSCEFLMQVSEINSNTDVNVHSVTDILSSVLPILEQWRQDRVKIGLLGSLGIGRASSLSLGFRVSLHCIAAYIRQAISRLLPTYEIYREDAAKAIDSLRKLPVDNRAYSVEADNITKLCDVIEESIRSEQTRSHKSIMKTLINCFFPQHRQYLPIL